MTANPRTACGIADRDARVAGLREARSLLRPYVVTLPISRYMTRQPWTIRHDAELTLARAMMLGILSERELALKLGEQVEDAMIVDVHTVSGDDAVDIVAAQMAERRHGSVVVVDRRGGVEGIFTTIDALRALAELARTQGAFAARAIPVGVSVRHVHLSRTDRDILFGAGYELTVRREVTQPGQFVVQETIDVIGPRGQFGSVGIIIPLRAETQVELARTDAIHLGVDPPLRQSGELAATPGIRLRGPAGDVVLDHGVILAQRHVHMSPKDALAFGVRHRDIIQVQVGGDREVLLGDVAVRVDPHFALDLHLDTDEANAAGITDRSTVTFAGIERRA
jgi:putative phosphotransacetylase